VNAAATSLPSLVSCSISVFAYTPSFNIVVTADQTQMGQSCFGSLFTLAAMTALAGSETADAQPILRICPPRNSRTSDFIKIFLHYMDQHPEQGPEFYLSVAVTALQSAHPCSSEATNHWRHIAPEMDPAPADGVIVGKMTSGALT
jgi:hypothetical protein